jgi:HK97 family phage major capsid protein/HK97 family phage prohead protease
MTLEIREEGGAPIISGYAVVFNSLSRDLGGFREVIAPGAFAGSLAGGDVRALWSHDHGIVLGRTKAGTLKITEDKTGLRVEIKPPQSAAGYVESIRRGDVDGMSFGFMVDRDDWTRSQDGTTVRTVTEGRLVEVSPVAFPAYPASSVGVRAQYGAVPEIPELIRRAPVKETKAERRAPATLGRIEQRAKGHNMSDKLAPVELRRKAQAKLERAQQLHENAVRTNERMSEEDQAEYDMALEESRRMEEQATREEELTRTAAPDTEQRDYARRNINLGASKERNEERAMANYIRTGDQRQLLNLRASNAVDMVESTPAAGGFAVPVGHHKGIIAKAADYMLADKLGVRRLPGKGLTVNVPVEAGTTNPFILTAEKAAKDKDSPQLGQLAFTLKKYTKVIPLTTELIEDEDSNLLGFIEDYVGKAMAVTHNNLLITAATAVGGALPGFAVLPLTGSVAAAGHIPAMVYALREPYADNAKFVMRRATEGAYFSLQGTDFVFGNGNMSDTGKPTIWGIPVYNSGDLAAIAALAKIAVLADWSYMGMRQADSIGFLRDPYSRVLENVVQLVYEFRVVYGVLQPEAGVVGQLA